ncbi:MAG TPA: hypothetical protein VG253_13640 [Streptosporangiaceae bacterium]|nr:hypothetical protein [Streptosporangiaceae bacterium]
MSATKAAVIGAISAEEANRWPRCLVKNAATPAPCCNLGWYKFRYMPSIASISNST